MNLKMFRATFPLVDLPGIESSRVTFIVGDSGVTSIEADAGLVVVHREDGAGEPIESLVFSPVGYGYTEAPKALEGGQVALPGGNVFDTGMSVAASKAALKTGRIGPTPYPHPPAEAPPKPKPPLDVEWRETPSVEPKPPADAISSTPANPKPAKTKGRARGKAAPTPKGR